MPVICLLYAATGEGRRGQCACYMRQQVRAGGEVRRMAPAEIVLMGGMDDMVVNGRTNSSNFSKQNCIKSHLFFFKSCLNLGAKGKIKKIN